MSSETRPLVAAAILLAAPVQAFAQPRPSISLSYAVAPDVDRCPDATAFRAAVAARLGRDPFGG